MALFAIDSLGNEVYADEVKVNNSSFICRHCKERMSFVNSILRIKHFRHLVESSCDPEPETKEHLFYKKLVFESLSKINVGETFLEYSVNNTFRPDVFLKRKDKRDIAIEVQATNTNLESFDAKIKYYSYRGFITVYLFVPKIFFHMTRENIYSLKEIEKRIFVSKYYNDSVLGGYIHNNKILLPNFAYKRAKGSVDAYCANRFIIIKQHSKAVNLIQYLEDIQTYVIKNKYHPECLHNNYKYVFSDEKIKRYRMVCSECGKHLKWLPNEEASKLRLNQKSV